MTSLLHHKGGVYYQGEYFFHIGMCIIVVFQIKSCDELVTP